MGETSTLLGSRIAAISRLSVIAVTVLFSTGVSAATVSVDGSVRYQRMDGFGTSVRVFDDPHVFENFNPVTGRAATVLTIAQQDQVLDRLYTDLKLTRVRPASPDTGVGSGIEPVNDLTLVQCAALKKVRGLRPMAPGVVAMVT